MLSTGRLLRSITSAQPPGKSMFVPLCSVVANYRVLPRNYLSMERRCLFRYTCHDVRKLIVYSCDYCDVIRSVTLLTEETVFVPLRLLCH